MDQKPSYQKSPDNQKQIAPAMLRRLLRYEPDTGLLYWRARTPDLFEKKKYSAEHKSNNWNSSYAGKLALNSICPPHNFKTGCVFGSTVSAHRIIMAMVNDRWPENVKHKNSDNSDNRWSNLQEVSVSAINKNRKMNNRNQSGFNGIWWNKQAGKWQVSIGVDNKAIYLGLFADINDAIAARKAANIKYGFSPEHGRRV